MEYKVWTKTISTGTFWNYFRCEHVWKSLISSCVCAECGHLPTQAREQCWLSYRLHALSTLFISIFWEASHEPVARLRTPLSTSHALTLWAHGFYVDAGAQTQFPSLHSKFFICQPQFFSFKWHLKTCKYLPICCKSEDVRSVLTVCKGVRVNYMLQSDKIQNTELAIWFPQIREQEGFFGSCSLWAHCVRGDHIILSLHN